MSRVVAPRIGSLTPRRILLAAAALALLAGPAIAQRPPAPKLLPDRTLAYIRVHDSREFVKKYNQTQLGRMLQDEKVRPFFASLFGSAVEQFKPVEDQVGASLPELLSIPQGEMCVAIVDPGVYEEEGDPVLVVILEVGKNESLAKQLMGKVGDLMTGDGAVETQEPFGDTELTVLTPGSKDPLVYFFREGTLVVTNRTAAAKDIIQTWDGIGETRKLAENRKFSGLMRRSRGTKDERPQVAYYADPILFFRVATKNNTGAQVALTFLPLLGLDGIKAVGGSIILDTEEFESIQHIHIMLDSPRRGLLKLLEFETGDGQPEGWVPKDVSVYMTAYFDFPKAFAEIDRVVARVRGEGAVQRAVDQRFAEPLGLDFQKDILDQWGGRVSFINWIEAQEKLNNQASLFGIQVRDPKTFRQTLDRVAAKFPQLLEAARFRQTKYYRIKRGRNRPNRPRPELVRVPSPCIAIVGDSLLIGDSEPCLKAAITTLATGESLGKELDFKLILSRIRGHLGTDQPSLIAFSRPEESLRGMYELATSEKLRNQLSDQQHPVAQALLRAMKEHPLPAYADIAKYFAPTGGVMLQDSAGLHYMAFGLKRN